MSHFFIGFGAIKELFIWRDHAHDIGAGTLFAQKSSHGFHIRVDVMQKHFIAFAEPAETGLAVGGMHKTVLGTFAVAGEEYIAFFALLRQGVQFITAEF